MPTHFGDPPGTPGPPGPPGDPGTPGDPGPAGGAFSGHVSYTFNAAITPPPIGNQLRLNTADQKLTTKLFCSRTSVDGLDVTIGLARILTGMQIHIQDFDLAARYVRYTVTASAVDKGTYFEIGVKYLSGPANVLFQKIEFQPMNPVKFNIPAGGRAGQVLAKISDDDYALAWVDP